MRWRTLVALVVSLLVWSFLTPLPAGKAAPPAPALIAARRVVPATEHPLMGGRPASAGLTPCDGGFGLYLYSDRDYAGVCLKTTTDIPRLDSYGLDNTISSLRFVGPYSGGHLSALLYADEYYGGRMVEVHSDSPNLDAAWIGPNELSSVRFSYRCAEVSQPSQPECQALVDLYNQTNGPEWTFSQGWLRTGMPCWWHGVQCTAGHVTDLNLARNQLSGTLPGSIGDLSKLKSLNLWMNRLTGSLPSRLGDLSDAAALFLADNQFSGSLPSSLGNLGQLRQLYLDNNQLSSSIPASLGNLNSLEYLRLSNNHLSGSIPVELGNLGNLKQLFLNQNQLSGGIPSTLGNLASLTGLTLQSNDLTGNLPSTLRYLRKLSWLRVDDNHLGGCLPVALTEMTALRAFHFEATGLREPPDAAFQAWLGTLTVCGRTGELCSQQSPTPTATGSPGASPTPTATGSPGASPTPTTPPAARQYLPVLLRRFSTWADDEFDGPYLDGRWTWINEDPSHWSLVARPGYLRLHLHSDTTGAKNLLLRVPPAGDWTAITRIEFAPVINFQSAGLVVWGGPGNLLKLSRGFCDLGPPDCVGDGICFERYEGGVQHGGNYALAWSPTSPVHLRLERVGTQFDGYCSADGLSWSYLGSHSPGFTLVGVGLAANQGTPDASGDADFDFFRVSVGGP